MGERLRIAVVSPLFESVPPKLYGGTERVVSYLTEELVNLGHHVTLFASGDSVTRAKLRAPVSRSLRLDSGCTEPLAHHAIMLDELAATAGQFDVIHFHIDHWHLPLARHLGLPAVTTLHGRLDIADLAPLYRRFSDAPLVSISQAQRAPLPWANWIATIHHGLPPDLYTLQPKPGSYLAFLGRFSPEKRPDRAIELARRAGIGLRMAAKVDRADKTYFEERIQPQLSTPGIEFVGEIGERDKQAFLGDALALLFPVDWPEPFGLVMIEAMACGTPVLAWRAGSTPEIVANGKSGFLVDNMEDALAAIDRLRGLDRAACRADFDNRFTVAHMARKYVEVYRRVRERSERPVLEVE
jgi:glycosyltransferase involved in cell wall biosynthesis